MKSLISLALLGAAANTVSAHYIFWQLSIGSTQYPKYTYVRQNSNMNSPVIDLNSTDLRCNVGASGANTQTIAVTAGQEFTFTTDTPVYHDGPVSLYMSQAPGAASDYDGSGPWFKIKDWGPTFNADGTSTWPLSQTYTFNIPTCIPNGDYLLRIQSLAIHNPYPGGIPQFYMECAQITVTGGGNAVPSPTALIPGFVSVTDPGYTVNIYTNFHNYTVPGPAVWSCGSQTGGSPPPPPPPASSSSKAATTSAKPTTTLATTPAPPSTTLTTSTKPTTTTTTTTSSAPPASCSAAKYAQCGGIGFNGCTTCASGSTCKSSSPYYSQCL